MRMILLSRLFCTRHEAREQRPCGNYRTQPRKPISVPRVERGYRSECIGRDQRAAFFPRQPRHGPPIRIDRSRHAGISRTQNPAVILDRPHASLIEMLCVGAAVAIPAVIRYIHKNLCAVIRKLPHFIWKHRLVADENSQRRAARISGARDCPRSKLSDFFSQSAGKCEQLGKRQVFSERHQMHFVVAGRPIARRTHQRRRIENFRSGMPFGFARSYCQSPP